MTRPLDFPADKFVTARASEANAFQLQAGAWKYDYDKLSMAQIAADLRRDNRPRWCAETFPGFASYNVLELGPGDGYITAGLEAQGVAGVTAIEGNASAFMRCLILKNAFDLKAKFLCGDFVQYVEAEPAGFDLVFAAGVLYHLTDPIAFLEHCSNFAPHLFLWTFLYGAEFVAAHPYERAWFKPEENEVKTFRGQRFTYHRRYYQDAIVEDAKYAGGLTPYAHWLTREDLFTVLDLLGYKILRTIPDSFQSTPAINVFASRA